MRLAMDSLRSFLVRSFSQAEDLAALLVVPVPVVLDSVLILNFEVLLVGLGHRLCGQPFHAPVVVHKEWHGTDSPFSASPADCGMCVYDATKRSPAHLQKF